MRKKILSILVGLVLAFCLTPFVSFVFAQAPTLIIESPKNGEVLNKDETLVKFRVENFKITDVRRNPPPQEGQGHLHLWIDQENPTAQNAIEHITSQPYLMTGIQPQEHTLVVELVGNDHSSLNPPVKKEVKFSTTAKARSKTGEVTQASPGTTTPKAKTLFSRLGTPLIAVATVVLVIVLGGILFYLRKHEQPKTTTQAKKPEKPQV
ncbi:hypothetical protein A2165_03790 [Candidatus Curtissbacteria bacterium RBG_13_40_7]|uniref:Uncharacterized protein n=1 Tax=Candidatus Curtissbacteria bacterium RBG_13_40_7 TaxID=1797706 RepID=A0A1F5FUL9_9BACT|nr:MAG: hypothetical protein A2165_03790 [Candidatus Curtissbacteria bacterium RBG_13_40_7]